MDGGEPWICGLKHGPVAESVLQPLPVPTSKRCICEELKNILHNDCQRQPENRPQTAAEAEQLAREHIDNCLQTLVSLQTAAEVSAFCECPQHGDASLHMVRKCQKAFCFVADTVSDTGDDPDKCCGDLSSVDEAEVRKRVTRRPSKAVRRAGKSLTQLNEEIEEALAESAKQGRELEEKTDLLSASREGVEKQLRDHVTRLHSLLDHHHQRQQDLLRQRHKDFLQQVLVTRLEWLNYEARLADLLKRVTQKVNHGMEHRDVTAVSTDDVTALSHQLASCKAQKPTLEVLELVYALEIPEATADELPKLLGRFIFTEDKDSPPPSQQSAGSPPADAATSSRSSDPGSASSARATSAAPFPAKAPISGTTSASSAQRTATGDTASASSSVSEHPLGSKAACKSPVSSSPADPKKQTSSESVASAPQKAKKKKKKKNKAKKEKKKALQQEKFVPSTPVPMSITTSAGASSMVIRSGLPPPPTGIAPTSDGRAWLVYQFDSPNLDLIDEDGDVVLSTRIGGNAVHVAVSGAGDVVVACLSPRSVRVFEGGTKEITATELDFRCTGLAVGSTGIAVSGKRMIQWISLAGDETEWIVPQQGSTLHSVCSLAVSTLQGQELVCAADYGAQAVRFYQKRTTRGEFAPLPPFRFPESGTGVEAAAMAFTPVSITAHRSGFLAVLDAASSSVFVVDVARNQAVSVIPGDRVCGFGCVPSVVAFVPTGTEAEPKLWVSSTDGRIFITSLVFLHW